MSIENTFPIFVFLSFLATKNIIFRIDSCIYDTKYESEVTGEIYSFKCRIYFPNENIFKQNLPEIQDVFGVQQLMPPRLQWILAIFYHEADPRLSNLEKIVRDLIIKAL